MATMVSQELFGGAIRCSFPANFVDASQFRHVPDHQELYVQTDGDQSIIVELVEQDLSVSNDEFAKYHFEEVAADNDAKDYSVVHSVEHLTSDNIPLLKETRACASILQGHQYVAKFNEPTRHLVNMYMAVVRLFDVETELLITFHQPVFFDSQGTPIQDPNTMSPQQIQVVFLQMLQSLRVLHWGLFRTSQANAAAAAAADAVSTAPFPGH